MARLFRSKRITARVGTFKRPAITLTLSLLLILCLLGSLVGQSLAPTIDKTAEEMIQHVSQYFSDTPLLDTHLTRTGFQPAPPESNWRRMPAIRKIETAYLAAQKVSQADADRLLARLASLTIAAFEPAKYVPAIAEHGARNTPGALRFAPLTTPPDPHAWSPPPTAQKAILEISRYADGGSLGGTANLMQFYLGVPEMDAYQILRSSNDSAEALKRAMTHVPEAERNPRLARVVRDLAEWYPQTAGKDLALISLLAGVDKREGHRPNADSSSKRKGPDGPGAPEAPGGGVDTGGGSGTSGGTGGFGRPWAQEEITVERPVSPGGMREAQVRTVARSHAQFTETWYRTAATSAFEVATGFRGGFGGVVFGNKIAVAPELKNNIESLVWLPPYSTAGLGATASHGLGQLLIRMKDGKQATFDGVGTDDAYAAWIMVFGGNGLPATPEGQLIGLVGLEGDHTRYDVSGNSIEPGARYRVVIHPALATSRLGQSVTMADALPIGGIRSLARQNLNAKDAETVESVWDDLDNWKITDAQLKVGVASGRIEVLRDVVPPGKDATYERQIFLDMVGFSLGNDKPYSPAAAAFRSAAPLVLKASEDFARVNRFAAVLAVFRAVRLERGKVLNPPAPVGDLATFNYLVIQGGNYKFQNAETIPDSEAIAQFRHTLESEEQKMPPAIRNAAVKVRQPVVEGLQKEMVRSTRARETDKQYESLGWTAREAARKAGKLVRFDALTKAYREAQADALWGGPQELAAAEKARTQLIELEALLLPQFAEQIGKSVPPIDHLADQPDAIPPLQSREKLMTELAAGLSEAARIDVMGKLKELKSLEAAENKLSDEISVFELKDRNQLVAELLKNVPAKRVAFESLVKELDAAEKSAYASFAAGKESEELAAFKRSRNAEAALGKFIDGLAEWKTFTGQIKQKQDRQEELERQVEQARKNLDDRFAKAVPAFEKWYALLSSVEVMSRSDSW